MWLLHNDGFYGLYCFETEPLCVHSLSHPELDDEIFYCLLTSMAAVQAKEDLFVGDLNDLVILGVTFDSKFAFAKHLRCSVPLYKAASQRLGILRKSSRVFHVGSLLGRCFRGFVLPVLE